MNTQFSPRVVQFKFSPPGGLWRHLQIISSCRKLRYRRLDTLNIKICSLFKEIQAEQVGYKICYRGGGTWNSHSLVLYRIKKEDTELLVDQESHENEATDRDIVKESFHIWTGDKSFISLYSILNYQIVPIFSASHLKNYSLYKKALLSAISIEI